MKRNSNPLVSVVIPAYNVQDYLQECVASVLVQTYSNLEIIIVDDGSIDNTPQICDRLKSEDKRIRVIHKANGGLSDARNVGFSAVQGEYMFFLDSDDFWRSETNLEEVVDFASKKNYDFTFIEINRSRYLPDTKQFYDLKKFPEIVLNSTDKNIQIQNIVSVGLFPMSACTKLLNVKFLRDHSISFIKGLYSEDIPWFLSILKNANAPIYYTNIYMYGNRKNPTSLTNTFNEKKFIDSITIIEKEISILDKSGDLDFREETISAIKSFFAYKYSILVADTSYYREEISDNSMVRLRKLDYLLKYDLHPKVKKVKLLMRLCGRKFASYILGKYLVNRDKIKA